MIFAATPQLTFASALVWPQPVAPLHSVALSALVAATPLLVVLILMGGLRKSGLFASACGLASAAILAAGVWRMPVSLAGWSVAYGFAFAVWSILWLVFSALWLYNLSVVTGSFDLLRRWMEEHASGDSCIQAMLVAFCFGALLEGSAGFGAPVAVTAFLLVGLGFQARQAVVVSLLANTAPVAFGGVGVPIVALAGVTRLDIMKLSAMVGRQLPFLSFILPAYLALVVAGGKGLRRSWPAALVAGGSFAAVQLLVSNVWGPYATDILSSLTSIVALVAFLRVWSPRGTNQAAVANSYPTANSARDPGRSKLSAAAAFPAWLPWASLSFVMVLWSYFKLFQKGQITIPVPSLHNGVLITLYQKPYSAIFSFQPLATGTAVLAATLVTALCFRVRPRVFLESGSRTVRQLRLPGLTVLFIVGLAYLYNYSGMAYTLGAAVGSAAGQCLSGSEQLPRLDRMFSERERYRRQSSVWQSTGCGRTSAASQSGAVGGYKFFGRGHGQDDLAAEYRDRGHNGRADRAGRQGSAQHFLAQCSPCGLAWADRLRAGILHSGDGAIGIFFWTRRRTLRWTGAREASFATCSITRALLLIAAPGQL